jgi:H/ACA ribonucleoprotein complex non-core subunit NAF1
MKTRGEILIEHLPPIEDLQISVPAEECVELGKISSIVDQLGMCESELIFIYHTIVGLWF